MTNFELVREFHERFRVHPLASPNYTNKQLSEFVQRRADLLCEEIDETLAADNLQDLIDGLVDTLYIAYGTLDLLGVDANAAFAEVHRSNMSKLGEDGEPIFNDQLKVQKGPNFTQPDLLPFVEQAMQGYLFEKAGE
jgi:predicted HAD superfamily Cof-like phosphohydrolase